MGLYLHHIVSCAHKEVMSFIFLSLATSLAYLYVLAMLKLIHLVGTDFGSHSVLKISYILQIYHLINYFNNYLLNIISLSPILSVLFVSM